MDARPQSRERVFSILNDNDCPSFVIRQQKLPPNSQSTAFPSPKQRRPSLVRQSQYQRSSSVSSTTSSSPPLLRHDSDSSKSSRSSMDSPPPPITPAYNYDASSLLYDSMMQQNMGLMASPSTVTPFMEQQMMLAPMSEQFPTKMMPHGLQHIQYPILPAPPQPESTQLPTPTSLNSIPTSIPASSATDGPATPNAIPTKKNKYLCPYSRSHHCSATFTTSGHAARHGKKHTGEKGVHCPVCDKAFTRKDNMKQHERTHKAGGSNSGNTEHENPRRSKAAITRDAQRTKQIQKSDSSNSDPTNQSSVLQSPLSEVTSAAPSLEAPMALGEQELYSTEPATQLNIPLLPMQPLPVTLPTTSLYPAMTDEALLAAAAANSIPLGPTEKLPDMNLLPTISMPPFVRGFSDLDTLAQAAETFDPYYQPAI